MPERNPYLILGVDFAASGDQARRAFAHAARRLRRHGGVWDIEDLNWALHQVEELEENPANSVDIYRVPADPHAFDPVGDGLFRPGPARLQRRTPATDQQALTEVRTAALSELDDLLIAEIGQTVPIPANGYELEETN
jgi:hypothetical protein